MASLQTLKNQIYTSEAVVGQAAADVDGVTVREVLPAAVGFHYLVTRVRITNKTASETPIVTIEDGAGTPVVHYSARLGGLADASSDHDTGELASPLVFADDEPVNADATTATGDCLVTIWASKVAN